MENSSKEPVAVITGAGTGIGRATALLLAQKGAKIIVSDIQSTNGEETAQHIRSAGGKAIFIHCDVTDDQSVKNLLIKSIDSYGPVTMAVNNAGIGGKMVPFHEVGNQDWHQMLQVNLTGVFYCMREEINAMLHHGGGSIVNVSSLAGLNGVKWGSPYTAAKHGVIGLTKSAALEYGKYHIRVNAVCPGFTDTPMVKNVDESLLQKSLHRRVPLKRMATPDEIARAIWWLLNSEASYVNGHCMIVDGGYQAG